MVSKKSIATIVAVGLIGGLISNYLPNFRIETKTLESGKQIQVERCSFQIDGSEVWEKYGPKGLEKVNSLFKDVNKNFYICEEKNYCKKFL
jgi:hypothetical protein